MSATIPAPGVRKPALVAACAAIVVAAVGAGVTDLGPWYRALHVPPWKPPDWAFGPIWTTVFTCAAISGVRAWRREPDPPGRRRVLWLFALNATLNVLWSVLFFHLHRPDWALVEVGALWLSIAALIVATGRRDLLAGVLLSPYLAWVSIAATLNAAIVHLNPPGAGP